MIFSRPKKSPGGRTHYGQSEEETKNIQVGPTYKTAADLGNLDQDHPHPNIDGNMVWEILLNLEIPWIPMRCD